MTEQAFIKKMEEIMDTEDELTMQSSLDKIEEWDSLSYVAFLAMADNVVGNHATPEAIRGAKTIGDLFALVQAE